MLYRHKIQMLAVDRDLTIGLRVTGLGHVRGSHSLIFTLPQTCRDSHDRLYQGLGFRV